jgi:hypothetical protein
MKVEEIAEAVAKLPPDQLAREAVAASAIGEEAVVADGGAASAALKGSLASGRIKHPRLPEGTEARRRPPQGQGEAVIRRA